MKIIRNHICCEDRYLFDFRLCTSKKHWAQVDTRQDASYYGTWANPVEMKILNYCEGDITIQKAENPHEFIQAILEFKEWTDKSGWDFLGIDARFSKTLEKWFDGYGLSHLLH